jgi:hypothetical protein
VIKVAVGDTRAIALAPVEAEKWEKKKRSSLLENPKSRHGHHSRAQHLERRSVQALGARAKRTR